MIIFIALIAYGLIPVVTLVIAIVALRRVNQLEAKFASATPPGDTKPNDSPWPSSSDDKEQAEPEAAEKSQPDEKPEEQVDQPEADTQASGLEAIVRASLNENEATSDKAGGGGEDGRGTVNPEKEPGFENRLAGHWTTILGGITLGLGLLFLVRHSIESGWFGPGARIAMGVVFSAALFAAGEFLRSSDRRKNLPVSVNSDVPSILTGVGALGAFATIYAAHALYGFIGPATAFIGLAIIALVSLFLSAVHGPALAALGTLGAYVAPLLVSSTEPNPVALAMHIVVVTACAMGLARVRGWTWLALAGGVASTTWVALMAAMSGPINGAVGMVTLLALALIFVTTFGIRNPEENEYENLQDKGEAETVSDRKPNFNTLKLVMAAVFALLSLAFLIQLAANRHLPETATGLLLPLTIIGAAIYWRNLTNILFSACFVTVIAVLAGDLAPDIVDGLTTGADLRSGLVPPDTSAFIRNALLIATPPVLLATWGAWRLGADEPKPAGSFAITATVIAVLSLFAAYLVVAPFETHLWFGLAGVALGFALILATDRFIRLDPENLTAPAPAAFAVGAVTALSFAIGVSLDKAWMPLAFALTALGIVGIYRQRPLAALPWLSLVAAILSGIALWFSMPFAIPDVSTTLIINELLTLLAMPAAALLLAGEILRRKDVQVPSAGLIAVGLAIGGLFVAFELVHLINSGDLANARQSLAETAAHALAALAFAYGLQRVSRRLQSNIYDYASYAAAAVSVAVITLGLLVVFNPYLTGASVGNGAIFNLLLPGYLLTGLAAAGVAFYARGIRPRWYALMYAALAGLLLFAYASLMLRKGFQGSDLEWTRATSDLEFWLYSPLWLLLGVATLIIGLKLQSVPVRAASGLLIGITIVKVFLLDMSELTGILRAFSFIGLGLSLMAIGRFYQRLLMQNSSEPSSTQPD